jgi:hypothetical protein
LPFLDAVGLAWCLPVRSAFLPARDS